MASIASMIGTLEALLIESLEPPQNRKRGDDFSAVEYIQDIDPELREREIQNTHSAPLSRKCVAGRSEPSSGTGLGRNPGPIR
ncbi:MAG: hypothetical protein IPL11_06765 [Candidatus Accumulibacter sp.]|nr:hypothetical protein [Accumulibacter sp.]